MSIIVSGKLSEVRDKLLAIATVINYRKTAGWPLFQDDEEWAYLTQGDDRVCELCWEIESEGLITGSDIPTRFPYYEVISWGVIHPHTHVNCRCRLFWEHPLETIEQRLHLEKLACI